MSLLSSAPRLIWAADSGSSGAVEVLLSAGVDANAKGFMAGRIWEINGMENLRNWMKYILLTNQFSDLLHSADVSRARVLFLAFKMPSIPFLSNKYIIVLRSSFSSYTLKLSSWIKCETDWQWTSRYPGNWWTRKAQIPRLKSLYLGLLGVRWRQMLPNVA